ncbi:MAG: hypothetical protein GX444_06325 [Myxococcales bacterium]|nr:hypothetical protein [Myxococcales bacterium]
MEQYTDQPESLAWTSHPVVEEPRRAWIVPVFGLSTAAVVWLVTQSPAWSAAGSLAVAVASLEWFLPTRYRLDSRGAYRRVCFFRRRLPWPEIRRICPDSRGVLLSPYPFATRWESFRGLYLRFSGNREAVLDFLAQKMAPAERN